MYYYVYAICKNVPHFSFICQNVVCKVMDVIKCQPQRFCFASDRRKRTKTLPTTLHCTRLSWQECCCVTCLKSMDRKKNNHVYLLAFRKSDMLLVMDWVFKKLGFVHTNECKKWRKSLFNSISCIDLSNRETRFQEPN